MENRKNILLLDSDGQRAQHIQQMLGEADVAYSLNHASTISEGLVFLQGKETDLVLLNEDLLIKADFPSIRNLLTQNNTPYLLLSDLAAQENNGHGGGAVASKSKVNATYLRSAISNTFKLAEAENKLNHVFEEYSGRIESFSLMLDMLKEAVLVLNKNGDIHYSNAKAYSLLADENFKKKIAAYLTYRERDEEEMIELKSGKQAELTMRINNFSWNGEPSNIFLIDRTEQKNEESIQDVYEVITSLLNTGEGNIVLLKSGTISFANLNALKELSFAEVVTGKPLERFFQTGTGNESAGTLKHADGTEKEIKYAFNDLPIDGETYQTFSFNVVHAEAITGTEYQPALTFARETNTPDIADPLQSILNYLRLIAACNAKGQHQQANDYSRFIKDAIVRMENILPDVTTHLALNDRTAATEKTSIKTIVTGVLDSMKPRIEALNAELNISELPNALADKELTRLVFTQLIDNALKFSKKNRKPVIDVGFDVTEGYVIFCVRDNGIGISKKDHSKIFNLFETLNATEDYPGNGFGLANCKKMVEMQGGAIWVEGLPGLGSNFYFTLESA